MTYAVEVTTVTVGALSPDTRSAWCSHMLMSPNLGTRVNIRQPKFSGLVSLIVLCSLYVYSCMWQQQYISFISDRIPT